MLKKTLLFFLILSILPLINSVTVTDTLYLNQISDYSIYINESIFLDGINITDSGRIEFYNVVSNLTHTPIFYNINLTHSSVLDLYGLNNAFFTNGTNICNGSNGDFSLNDGNINITLFPGEKCFLLDNYQIVFPGDDEGGGGFGGGSRPNDPLYNSTESGAGNFSSTIILRLFNLNNALLHNNTNICNGSNSNVNLNTGNINITLFPNQFCYILDDYSLIEGINRSNNPLRFSFSSDTEKHIASNLTDTISSDVTFNVTDCKEVRSITYTSDTGNFSKTYDIDDYSCENNQVSLFVNGIETAIASNILLIEYNTILLKVCDNIFDAFNSVITLIGLIILIVLIGVILTFVTGFGIDFNISLTSLPGIIVMILVALIILDAGMLIIGGMLGC